MVGHHLWCDRQIHEVVKSSRFASSSGCIHFVLDYCADEVAIYSGNKRFCPKNEASQSSLFRVHVLTWHFISNRFIQSALFNQNCTADVYYTNIVDANKFLKRTAIYSFELFNGQLVSVSPCVALRSYMTRTGRKNRNLCISLLLRSITTIMTNSLTIVLLTLYEH